MSKWPTTRQPLRGALVGAGRVSEFHLLAWSQQADVQIAAIADIDLAKARARAEQFGLAPECAYASLEDLLAARPGLDFVDVASPPGTHPALVECAAQAGVAIFCQKPLAKSLADARRMIAVAENRGVPLIVNENWRWRPWYRRIRNLLETGIIGRPVYVRLFAHGGYWTPGSQRELRPWMATSEMGVLLEIGVHHLDVLRFLFGDPQEVYARQTRLPTGLGGEDRMVVMLGYDGLTGLVDESWSSFAPWGHPDRQNSLVEDLRIEGDAGTLLLCPNPGGVETIRVVTANDSWEEPAYQGPVFSQYLASYVAAQAHFLAVFRGEIEPETPATDNLLTLAITLAAYQSANTGQVVNVKDFLRAEPETGVRR